MANSNNHESEIDRRNSFVKGIHGVKRRIENAFYDFNLLGLPKILPRYFDITVTGRENLPEHGVIIAPNHSTCIDHYILGMCLDPRQIHFYVQAENIKQKLLLNGYHWAIGNIWVMVDGDRAESDIVYRKKQITVNARATRRARDYLRFTNDDIGIFIDGPTKDNVNQRTGAIIHLADREFKEGAAFLAMKTGRQVVPISLRTKDDVSRMFWEVGERGYPGLFKDLGKYVEANGKIPYHINIGGPLSFGRGYGVLEATRAIKKVVCHLYDTSM